jgi:L-iditol 2-dehydrogenase
MLGAGSVVATDMSDFRLNMAKKFGADQVFNAGKTTAAEIAEYLKSITAGRGADVVVTCTGLPKSLIEGIEMLRKGGTFIEVGSFVDKGEIPVNPHRHLCSKNIRLIGMTNLAYVGYLPVLRMMKAWSKYFDFNKLVTHTYGLEDAEKALLKSMEPDSMKVAVKPN